MKSGTIDFSRPEFLANLTKVTALDLLDLGALVIEFTRSAVARKTFSNSKGSRAQSFFNLTQAVSALLVRIEGA